MEIMKITPDWRFDFNDPSPDTRLVTHWDTITFADFMAIISRHIVSGPVDLDLQDRYGWLDIPISAFPKLQADINKALADWVEKD